VNNGELCRASGCESCCVMPGQWLSIMLIHAEPVVVNQMCYDEPVVVDHCVLC
jgi:hypothetical protein